MLTTCVIYIGEQKVSAGRVLPALWPSVFASGSGCSNRDWTSFGGQATVDVTAGRYARYTDLVVCDYFRKGPQS